MKSPIHMCRAGSKVPLFISIARLKLTAKI